MGICSGMSVAPPHWTFTTAPPRVSASVGDLAADERPRDLARVRVEGDQVGLLAGFQAADSSDRPNWRAALARRSPRRRGAARPAKRRALWKARFMVRTLPASVPSANAAVPFRTKTASRRVILAVRHGCALDGIGDQHGPLRPFRGQQQADDQGCRWTPSAMTSATISGRARIAPAAPGRGGGAAAWR